MFPSVLIMNTSERPTITFSLFYIMNYLLELKCAEYFLLKFLTKTTYRYDNK
jgi:hypothetical protein